MTLDSIVSYENAKAMYRIITRACRAATAHFVENLPKVKIKPEYTVAEIIEIVGNNWGAETFRRFFENNRGG